jgi:hypothetical protein
MWSSQCVVRKLDVHAGPGMKISGLKPFQDCEVAVHITDGEVLRAKVTFVDLEYEDIIVNVLETHQPEHYKDPYAAYTVAASDVSVRNSD